MIDYPKLRCLLGSMPVEKEPGSENLATVLFEYFETHIDRPDEPTDEYGNSPWVVEKANEALDVIVSEMLKKLYPNT